MLLPAVKHAFPLAGEPARPGWLSVTWLSSPRQFLLVLEVSLQHVANKYKFELTIC